MRVALIMECPLLQTGGVEVLVRELTLRLAQECEVVLVTDDEESALPEAHRQAIVAHVRLPLPHTHAAGAQLCAALRHLQIDLAHFHLGGTYAWNSRDYFNSALRAFVEHDVPFLVTNHGVFGFFGYCGPQQPLWKRLAVLPYFWLSRLYFIARSRGEVMVSRNDLGKMQRWFFPLRGKMRTMYHALLPDRAPDRTGKRIKRFLCVGTIGLRKGQWLLTEAFATIHHRVPDWRLTIVGRFADDMVRQMVMTPLTDPAVLAKVDFVEKASDAEVKAFYGSSEIFVMPSLEEGLGLTLQEALFYGCACITARAGGTEDLVTDGDNGLLVDRNHVPQLAAAMLRLATDDELRSSLVERGPESIEEKGMNAASMGRRHAALYREILS